LNGFKASPEALQRLSGELHLNLQPGQVSALLAYLATLGRWNTMHNLTAVRTAEGMWTQHLADCLAVVRPVEMQLARSRWTGRRVLDVGSGGGLPGVVLAVCLPDVQVTCVDAVGKKAAFVRQVAGELRLPNLHSLHARVESLKEPPFDMVVCRAFSDLAGFASLTRPLLASTGLWMAMKGQLPHAEIAQLPADVDVFHVEQLVVPGMDAQRCLVWMRPGTARSDVLPTAS